MRFEEINYLTAFLIGILSSGHCLSMCGGVVSIISISTNINNKFIYQLCYNFGRIFSYIFISLIANYLGLLLINIGGYYFFFIFKFISNLFLILIGLYLINYFKYILYIENFFYKFWGSVLIIIKKINVHKSYFRSFLLGFFWGYVPCGLIYSTIIWSLGFNSILKSSILIFFFGLGTLPSMFLVGYFASHIKEFLYNKIFKIISSSFIIFFGLFNIINLIFIKSCH